MPNKNYWNTVEGIMEFTQALTGEDLHEDIENVKKRKEKASDEPMKEITFMGLVGEFFDVAGETMDKYAHAKTKEERANIIKEINEASTDILNTIAEEVSEASDYLHQRLEDMEEENRLFAEEIKDSLAIKKFSDSFNEDSIAENWSFARPVLGDHIRVERYGGLYYHHGIYVGNNKVIHFAPESGGEIINWEAAEVVETSLETFLKGGEPEVRQYSDEERLELYSPKEIVQNAKHCLGYKNYNLIFNNCEHFANSCTTGKHRSPQVEEVFSSALLLLD